MQHLSFRRAPTGARRNIDIFDPFYIQRFFLTVACPTTQDAAGHSCWRRVPAAAARQTNDVRNVGFGVARAPETAYGVPQPLRILRGRFCLLSQCFRTLFPTPIFNFMLVGTPAKQLGKYFAHLNPACRMTVTNAEVFTHAMKGREILWHRAPQPGTKSF